MADFARFARVDLSGKDAVLLDIDGTVFRCSHVSTSWALNSIPIATCLLAVGRDVQNVRKRAEVHNVAASQLFRMKPAKITVNIRGQWSPRDNTLWPDKTVTIFEGVFTGFAFRKVQGKVQAIGQLLHFFSDLAFSSALSANSHPGNPARFSAGAILDAATVQERADAGTLTSPVMLSELVDIDSLLAEKLVSKDLWGAIKTFFCLVAKRDFMDTDLPGASDCLKLIKNDQAFEALTRIEGGIESSCPRDLEFAKNTLGGKGEITLAAPGQNIEFAMAMAITGETVGSWVRTTLWDKLAGGFTSSFSLAVVPMSDRGLVIAHNPTLRTEFKKITPEEYSSLHYNAIIPRPIRAMVISSALSSETGIFSNKGEPLDAGVGGCFVATGPEARKGMTLVELPPPWLQYETLDPERVIETTNLGNKTPIQTATMEGKPKIPPIGAASFLRSSEAIYARWAQDRYTKEVLRGRTGALTGKLRFDIAPGSIVFVTRQPELQLGSVDELAASIFGYVVRVQNTLDSDTLQATTTIAMSHIRTESENNSDDTAVDEHPLYGQSSFIGAPLVPEFEFPG